MLHVFYVWLLFVHCSLAEVSDDDSEGEGEGLLGDASILPTYAEEQEQLKENFKGAVDVMEEEEGEGGEEILTLRKKTKQEEVKFPLSN